MPGIITTTGEWTAGRILPLLLSRLPITEKVYTKIMHAAKTGRPCAVPGFAYVLFVYRKRGPQDSGLFLICNVPGNTKTQTRRRSTRGEAVHRTGERTSNRLIVANMPRLFPKECTNWNCALDVDNSSKNSVELAKVLLNEEKSKVTHKWIQVHHGFWWTLRFTRPKQRPIRCTRWSLCDQTTNQGTSQGWRYSSRSCTQNNLIRKNWRNLMLWPDH